ncbi:hypothetical protein GCM10008018_17390 [Paenibacillus marchantiophytorum]|uniref:Beta-glucosidase n=1 Tax=Paenibacillus marchantiophytorum TaxID=1619310 RepID=A0ABQ2BU96_9BACL|nr:glycoside hydrolase family 3 N-terminal domain-containing protein [Paenibacillus marchantiophytorum]GGI46497.1 hypothetical protein GCM10008018_17390 [Paenibacillus marchantiophytorum]
MVTGMKKQKKMSGQRLFKWVFSLVMAASIIAPQSYTPVSAQALPGLPDVARQVAAEGIVLLQNPDYKTAGSQVNEIEKVLPIKKSENVSVFGRIQTHYYKSGTGSGGAVRVDYVNGILEGLRNNPSVQVNEDLAKVYTDWVKTHPFDNGGGGWAAEPWSQAEMPLTADILNAAKSKSDTAIAIIGRTAGEDKDNKDEKGAYRLTDLEVAMLDQVYAKFDRVAIVLNVANVIDMSWAKNYPKASILYAWQGGMEGGSAVADVLTGDVTPSGKLSDTIAKSLADYPSTANFGSQTENKYAEDIYVGYRYFETFAPDKVLYPFGFGLSYTNFQMTTDSIKSNDKEITINVTVNNTGKVGGKEVVQIYYGAPQGKLGKPAKQLVAFAKTGILQPGHSQQMAITFDINDMASYDDSGVTGHDSSYVLEAGDYNIYVGNSVRDSVKAGAYQVADLKVVKELQEALAPTKPFDRIKPGTLKVDGTFNSITEAVPTRSIDLTKRIKDNLPAAIAQTGDKGYKLVDVYDKKVTMDEFIAQFSNNDLGAIILGEGMSSPKVTAGTAAAFGGVTKNLLKFGLPIDSAADGPSGIRMETDSQRATSIPNGTMLASSWNIELVERLYFNLGKEMRLNNIDTILGPGINIHRNPLNGRNFEYFSEDPLLTGMMAIVQTRGLQRHGTTPTLKHFAANNQESARHSVNGLISERALREIYLKGYEMAVKSGKARSVMTSYGPVNGTWASSNYDLNTTILRGEWGFDGIVMTDWWARLSEDQGFYAATNRFDELNGKAMVRAQNDVYMVIPDGAAETHKNRGSSTFNTVASLTNGSLTLGELQRSAKNISRFLMLSPAFARTANIEYKVDYTPGKDWFRVDTAKLGDPVLSGITVGGKNIKTFNPLKLDYKAYGDAALSHYPEVQAVATGGAVVDVVQASPGRPAAVITATAGGQQRIYKVIFTSEEGLEPIFENPTYAYLKNISINGKPIDGFRETRLSYDVGVNSVASLPEVAFETNAGVTATATVDTANRRVSIKAISSDQANTYVIQFGKIPQSDEFNATALNSFWTINKETATNSENKANWSLTAKPGSLRIIGERGDFWSEHTDLKNYFQQEAFGNWEATVKVNLNKTPNQNYNAVGITASQDNNNYIFVKYEYSEGKIIGMVKETGGVMPVSIGQLSASQIANLFGEKTEIYLRLKRLGNVYSGYVSADGTNYISLGNTTADYANPKFGLLASNGSQTLTDPFYADFDYVRFNMDSVTAGVTNIGPNTKLKVAETESAAITSVITPVACNDVDGGLCYTNTAKGEAISYKVNVTTAGEYRILSRIRSSQSDVAQMSFGLYDGANLLGTFDLTTTKGEWATFKIPDVALSKGEHTLRIVFESAGIDLNWLKFQLKQDGADTSKLADAIRAAESLDLSPYSVYKKARFSAVLANVKLVLAEPINDAVVTEAIADLAAAVTDLKTAVMPKGVAPKATEKVTNGIRIYPYNAPWIFTSNGGFRFESGTDAMSYVNPNDITYFGKIDLTNLVEVRVQYAREGGTMPYFRFYTEAENTGNPVKGATTQGRAYSDLYSGGSFDVNNEFASINFNQKAGAAWSNYGIASTKQVGDNPYLENYLGAATNFVDKTKATGLQNVYMKFDGLNTNLQYVEFIYDGSAPASTIVSVVQPQPLSVAYGTGFEQLGLPATATVNLSNNATKAIAVQWNGSEYNGNAAGTYTLNGTLAAVDGVTNPNNLKASISVTVLPQPAKAKLSGPISASTGMTVDFTYGLEHIVGEVAAQDVTVTYDTYKLELVSNPVSLNGEKFIIVDSVSLPGQIRMLGVHLSDYQSAPNKDLMKLTFKIKPEAAAGVASVSVSKLVVADRQGKETTVAGAAHQLQIIAVDKTALSATIASAQSKYDAAVVGTLPGQYPAAAKAALQTSITAANTVLSNAAATQDDVDHAVTDLNAAIQAFTSSVITTSPSDTNGDGKLSIGDLGMVAASYGKTSADPNWEQIKSADVNKDGKIDVVDLAIVARAILELKQ